MPRVSGRQVADAASRDPARSSGAVHLGIRRRRDDDEGAGPEGRSLPSEALYARRARSDGRRSVDYRRARKNRFSSSPHSSAINPPSTSGRWLRPGGGAGRTPSPPFRTAGRRRRRPPGRSWRARCAPAHCAHGSSVTYSVASGRRSTSELVQRTLQRQHLGVRRGVAAIDGFVVRLGQNLAVAHDHRADGNLLANRGRPGPAGARPPCP